LLGEAAGLAGQVGKTVIGHHPEYVEKALEVGAGYLNIPMPIWRSVSEAERWAANVRFLDRASARGDEIILATKASAARAGTFFARELKYLASKGYRIAEDGMRLIAPGK